jgi:3-methylfumaryl-CoA hydratase
VDAVTERTELLTPEPADALGGLLGVQVPDLRHGAGLPLLWHWIYLLERPPESELGPDGHPRSGLLAPYTGPGRRRMWAGGHVRADGVLRCGEPATRRSQVVSVQEKQGRSGPLVFVTVGHQISQRGAVVLEEQQELVYRSAGPAVAPGAGGGPVVEPAEGEWAIEITPVLLFRFSALTYNSHRIHYDRDYARDVEGYPGLLTHGPLQALAMAEAARFSQDVPGTGLTFEYRLTAPLFDHQGLVVSARREQDSVVTSARDRSGRTTATGRLAATC